MVTKKEFKSDELRPLKELSPFTPYTTGYLSLMARRGELKVKKVEGIWWSTLGNIKDFEDDRKKRPADYFLKSTSNLQKKERCQQTSQCEVCWHLLTILNFTSLIFTSKI